MNESEMNDVDAEGQAGSSTPDTTPEQEQKTAAAVENERVFTGTGLFWGLVFGVLLAVIMHDHPGRPKHQRFRFRRLAFSLPSIRSVPSVSRRRVASLLPGSRGATGCHLLVHGWGEGAS